jgi:hypothetical protein
MTMPKSITINLIPNDEKQEDKKNNSYIRNIVKLGIVTLLGVIFIFGVKYGMNFYELEAQAKELDELALVTEEESFKTYLDAYNKYVNHEAKTVLAEHPYYSQLIDHFEESLSDDIKITSLKFDGDTSASINGFSQSGIRGLSMLQNDLDKRGYTDLNISSLSLNQESDNVTFTLNFKYDQSIIKK